MWDKHTTVYLSPYLALLSLAFDCLKYANTMYREEGLDPNPPPPPSGKYREEGLDPNPPSLSLWQIQRGRAQRPSHMQ